MSIQRITSCLPITRQCYPDQESATLLKTTKLALYILSTPFLLLADAVYAAYNAIKSQLCYFPKTSNIPPEPVDVPVNPPPTTSSILPEPVAIPVTPSPSPTTSRIQPDQPIIPPPTSFKKDLPSSPTPSLIKKTVIFGLGAIAAITVAYCAYHSCNPVADPIFPQVLPPPPAPIPTPIDDSSASNDGPRPLGHWLMASLVAALGLTQVPRRSGIALPTDEADLLPENNRINFPPQEIDVFNPRSQMDLTQMIQQVANHPSAPIFLDPMYGSHGGPIQIDRNELLNILRILNDNYPDGQIRDLSIPPSQLPRILSLNAPQSLAIEELHETELPHDIVPVSLDNSRTVAPSLPGSAAESNDIERRGRPNSLLGLPTEAHSSLLDSDAAGDSSGMFEPVDPNASVGADFSFLKSPLELENKIIETMHKIHAFAEAQEGREIGRGSYTINDPHGTLWNLIKNYYKFANNLNGPDNIIVSVRDPSKGHTSHHKDSMQFGIDIRKNNPEGYAEQLLPGGNTHLLCGKINPAAVGENQVFIKFEPYGLGTYYEYSMHGAQYFLSFFVKETDRREKDIYPDIFDAYQQSIEEHNSRTFSSVEPQKARICTMLNHLKENGIDTEVFINACKSHKYEEATLHHRSGNEVVIADFDAVMEAHSAPGESI